MIQTRSTTAIVACKASRGTGDSTLTLMNVIRAQERLSTEDPDADQQFCQEATMNTAAKPSKKQSQVTYTVRTDLDSAGYYQN